MDWIKPGMAIDARKARPDVAIGHGLARVDVGAEIVAGDAGRGLDLQDELSRDTLG